MRNSIFVIKILLSLAVAFIECKRPDADVNLKTLVKNYGYTFETYEVTTEDGYILEIHRIPRGRNETNNSTKKKPVALLMHGILGSSATWIITGPHRSMALMLADKGYDVWLGNSRGNTYSTKHSTKLETSFEYWDFSWHEMGIYDLPATIDFVLKNTGEETLFYNCFSQGCTQAFVMGSLRPDYNKKINFALALAPAAFMGHAKGILASIWPITYLIVDFSESWGYYSVVAANPILRVFTSKLCKNGSIWQDLCFFIFFLMVGFGYDEADREYFSYFLAFEPAGSSWKQFVHYGFLIWNPGTFKLFDYGPEENLKIYNSTVPPDYPLEKVNFPVAIIHGTNDFLAHPSDVEILAKKLPNVLISHLVTEKKLNHYDFVFGQHAKELIYNPALQFHDKYMKSNK